MKCPGGLALGFCVQVALHVHGDPLADVLAGANAVDGLLHFSMATVGAFHGIGCGRQQGVIKEGKGLLEIGREEFLERLSQCPESPDTTTQFGEFFQCGIHATSAIEETIDFIDDLT